MITALAAFAVAYRFYGAFLAAKVAVLNDRRTPRPPTGSATAWTTTRPSGWCCSAPLRGHCRPGAADRARCWPRSGATFPGFAWIVIGACLAGGVHDFVILVASVRQDGLTLPKLARNIIGPVAGVDHGGRHAVHRGRRAGQRGDGRGQGPERKLLGHVHDPGDDPGGAADRLWMYKIRPGRVGEASVVGVTIVMLGVILGKPFADSALGHYLLFNEHDAVDHAADLRGHRLDPAGVGADVPARLPQLVHEDRRDRGVGRGDLSCPARR